MKLLQKLLAFTLALSMVLSLMSGWSFATDSEDGALKANSSYDDYDDDDDDNDYDDDDDDYDDDDYDDDDYDDDDYDDDTNYSYNDVNKEYGIKDVSSSKDYHVSYKDLEDGKTNDHLIHVTASGNYVFTFTNGTYGELGFLITDMDHYDSQGYMQQVYQKDLYLGFESWTKTIRLSKGRYCVSVLSMESIGLDYELSIRSEKVKKTEQVKLTSCDTKKLNPKLGKGNWKTSNSKIVELATSKSNAAACTIRAKATGTANVTYTNSTGSKITYKVKVTASKTYPFDDAYFTMNSVGGLEPHILISNNSTKKIKYVYITVSFYNAVGDRVRNEIGGYKNAKLELIGPVKPWRYEWYEFDPVFYNDVAHKMKVETVKVIYFGGSKKTIKVNKKFKLVDDD